MKDLLARILGWIPSLFRSRASLEAEILALRHQVLVLQWTSHRLREFSGSPGLLEVVGAFTGAVDAHLHGSGRTDLAEMSQLAAAETLKVIPS